MQRDAAGGRGADRRARRARRCRCPGGSASQARRSQNGEVIGPLTGQISVPPPRLIGPAGSEPGWPLQRARWIFACWALRSARWPSSCCALACGRATARCACPARVPRVADARADQLLLDLRRSRRGARGSIAVDRLLAALERGPGAAAVAVASAFASRTSVTIVRSCSEMRRRNSPRSSRSAKPLEFSTTVTRSGLSAL